MAEVKWAIISQKGHCAYLMKLLQSVNEHLATTTPLTADQVATLRDLHEQLSHKYSFMDTKILKALDNNKKIEAEMLQTEETTSLISIAKAKIIHRLTPTVAEMAGRNLT